MCSPTSNPQDSSADITSSSTANANPSSPSWKWNVITTLLLPPTILTFSLHFPFHLPGPLATAALQTYIPARYIYDEQYTKFDNSIWTYATDYMLTFVMFALACCIVVTTTSSSQSSKQTQKLRYYSAAMLTTYGLSTLAGGIAHQTVRGVDNLNTIHFQLLWIVCVGNVSFASCWMGLIGREIVSVVTGSTDDYDSRREYSSSSALPLGPWYIWPYYGCFMTAACALGYMSFKRPACDIFIAGITQFPTTFYCLGALITSSRNNNNTMSKTHPLNNIQLKYKIMYYIGFIGNAPLLPLYPLLVQYTNLTLAGINTLLHTWLLIMWGMQGLSLWHVCEVIDDSYNEIMTDGISRIRDSKKME